MRTKKYPRVGIVGKLVPVPSMVEDLRALAKRLEQLGFYVVVESKTAEMHQLLGFSIRSVSELRNQVDAVVVLGGDGTMLGLARELAGAPVAVIGVNYGRLGFVTDIALQDMHIVIPQILSGYCTQESRTLLFGRIVRKHQVLFEALSFNDIVVNRLTPSGMVELAISVDGHFIANQRADGIIVSTPTGSTAYALSAGGPIIHPAVDGILLAPIVPHTLSNRPIMLSGNAKIELVILNRSPVSVAWDMQNFFEAQENDVVEIQRAHERVTLLHPLSYDYFVTLRKKLGWNDDHRY